MIVKTSPIIQKYKFFLLTSDSSLPEIALNPRNAVTIDAIPTINVNMKMEIAPVIILINPYFLVNLLIFLSPSSPNASVFCF